MAGIMNLKECGRKRGLIPGAVLAFAWKDRGKPQTTSQGSCIPSEVQTQFRNAAVAGDLPQHVSEVYQAAVVTSEHLRDLNKYWCEQCLRYNEARRCVRYETLPKLLVLQLKRFSSTFGWVLCSVSWCDHILLQMGVWFHATFHIFV